MPGSAAGIPGERALIRRILDRLPPPPQGLIVPAGDDAAVWTPPRGGLDILTTDALVEGVHFDFRFCTPADAGYRALAVNVSDIAAMGGAPHLALLSMVLPHGCPLAVVDGVVDGLLEMAAEARVHLAGGNIAVAGALVLDVTVLGSARPRKVLTRTGARPGDFLYVTGSLGAAAAGLDWLQTTSDVSPGALPDGPLAESVRRYRRPQVRARIGALLGRTRTASACIDTSDGLGDALRQLAEASGVGLKVQAADLPIDPGARERAAARNADVLASIAASDDYELLFTVPRKRMGRLRNVIREARGIPITRIGEVVAGRSLVLSGPEGELSLPPGFEHAT